MQGCARPPHVISNLPFACHNKCQSPCTAHSPRPALLTFSRPVYARMRRTTDRQASVPELTKRTISTEGTRSITILASTFCRQGRGGGDGGSGECWLLVEGLYGWVADLGHKLCLVQATRCCPPCICAHTNYTRPRGLTSSSQGAPKEVPLSI